jgi:hypothetical protein
MASSCCSHLRALALVTVLLFNSAFAADLQPPTGTIPATYFGLHIHHAGKETPWPNMPVPEWRIWDAYVTWHDLEPYKGDFRFDRLDGYVALAHQHGTGVQLPLGMTPSWAGARPQAVPAEPPNLDDWRTFVRTVVTRYKGRIDAYEIWNEPNLKDFWTGTVDQMLVLTKEASQIIHSVDPKAIVVSPSATASYGTPWLADFLKKGGGQYVDVIGYHFYVIPHTASPEEMVPVIQSVRKILSDNGLANKPLWNTETGWLDPARFDSEEVAAGFLARAYIVVWATGVQRFYWYAWDNRHVALKTTKEDNVTQTPAGNAYKIIQQWLVGAQMDSCKESSEHTWTCQLSRDGEKQWIVWNSQGKRKFDVPEAWHVKSITPLLRDRSSLSGSTIDSGPVPVLLTGKS